MGGTVNYDRDKDPKINDTPIDIDFLAGEEPTSPLALTGDNSGSTGILNLTITADVDETGGVDVQDLFRIEDLQILIDQTTGRITLQMNVIPVLGDETDAPTETLLTVIHPQTMDVYQTAGGRVQQP